MTSQAKLFMPLSLRGVTLRNRIGVSPMCTYSAEEGMPQAWHLVHLGARAVGGAGLVFSEAVAVEPRGRISPADTGLWSDAQADAWAPITRFLLEQGALPGVQLAHAGRKASTAPPRGEVHPLTVEEGGWQVVAPSPLAFSAVHPVPVELDEKELMAILAAFVSATRRAHRAGFRVIELHMAHGYLLHSFLSPLANKRADRYGGDRDGRMAFPLEVAREVRKAWPEELPLFVRISTTDWLEGGWEVGDSVVFAGELKRIGVDVVDCSAAGLVPKELVPHTPEEQPPLAGRVRREAGVATAAVGGVTEARQAEEILARGDADLVLLGREMLRNPYWPLHAARELGADPPWPVQYLAAVPR